MEISLFDLHCDTAFEAHRAKLSLLSNDLSVSFDKAKKYAKYSQVFAFWSEAGLDDESAFDQFIRMHKYFTTDISTIPRSDLRPYILAVEDARILNNDITRLDYLKSCNIKILTLTWSGTSCIGGAYDTDHSLTEFGEDVVRKCFELGIVVDISHSSRKTAQKVFELNDNKHPIIASHSNVYSVFSHPRNLTDTEIKQIIASSGLIGINLYYKHLGLELDALESTALDRILEHIEYILSLGGEGSLCFGCDLDGAVTPNGLKTVGDLDKIADKMISKGYSETTVNNIFWDNANKFANKNLLYK